MFNFINDINVKKVNKLIADFEQIGNKAEVLEIGYKTYAVLMAEERFSDKVSKSKELLYKRIKIKLITEKYHFEVK